MNTLLDLGVVAIAALVTRWVAAGMIPSARALRRNHRGIPVATGLGVAVLIGLAAAIAFLAVVAAIQGYEGTAFYALAASPLILLPAFGFGLLGLFDDMADQKERGWRSHVTALLHGRATPGSLKIVGGFGLSLVLAAGAAAPLRFLDFGFGLGRRTPELAWVVFHAVLIALMANLFNALDVRPGRAGKFYLVAAVPMTILARFLQVPLAATLGAVFAFLTLDLRERAMLGDAGSNAIGALLGVAIVAVDPPTWFQFTLVGFLVALTAVAEGPTLSAWIDRIGPLRAFDRAGRADAADATTT